MYARWKFLVSRWSRRTIAACFVPYIRWTRRPRPSGKSLALDCVDGPDSDVGQARLSLGHLQSNLADFYRDMVSLFRVPLKSHNRWDAVCAIRTAADG